MGENSVCRGKCLFYPLFCVILQGMLQLHTNGFILTTEAQLIHRDVDDLRVSILADTMSRMESGQRPATQETLEEEAGV